MQSWWPLQKKLVHRWLMMTTSEQVGPSLSEGAWLVYNHSILYPYMIAWPLRLRMAILPLLCIRRTRCRDKRPCMSWLACHVCLSCRSKAKQVCNSSFERQNNMPRASRKAKLHSFHIDYLCLLKSLTIFTKTRSWKAFHLRFTFQSAAVDLQCLRTSGHELLFHITTRCRFKASFDQTNPNTVH